MGIELGWANKDNSNSIDLIEKLLLFIDKL